MEALAFGRRQMRKAESIIVGLVLGIAIPLLTFIVFWWTMALIHLSIPGIPVEVVIVAAFAGLFIGILFDLVFLNRCVLGFYTANPRILMLFYVGLCIVAVALFMGLPVGTLLMGVGAGVYVGRRCRNTSVDTTTLTSSTRQTAAFAAFVTALAALPIGLLALDDPNMIHLLETGLPFDDIRIDGVTGPALVVFLCYVLFAIQYCCTLVAGKLSYGLWK